jgi:hypothetical protein
MPNGGPDCCGQCAFNRTIQKIGSPNRTDESDRQEFWNNSYCTLRFVKLTKPFWTYCANYSHDAPKILGAKATGWIFASGIYEGYVRIPWHGSTEPMVGVPTTCSVCGRKTESGIELTTSDDSSLGFCSNRHYVAWWRTQHNDPAIRADHFADPEETSK